MALKEHDSTRSDLEKALAEARADAEKAKQAADNADLEKSKAQQQAETSQEALDIAQQQAQAATAAMGQANQSPELSSYKMVITKRFTLRKRNLSRRVKFLGARRARSHGQNGTTELARNNF